jgi:hypothetical protein
MTTGKTVKPTRAERQTTKLRDRLEDHIRKWYSRVVADFPDLDFYFHVADRPYELWTCELSRRSAPPPPVSTPEASAAANEDTVREDTVKTETEKKETEKKGKIVTIWLLWDCKEVTSYEEDDLEDAFLDLINGQKAVFAHPG